MGYKDRYSQITDLFQQALCPLARLAELIGRPLKPVGQLFPPRRLGAQSVWSVYSLICSTLYLLGRNLPAITIRNTQERPEGMDVGTFVMSGLKKERVLEAVKVVLAQHNPLLRVVEPVGDYEALFVSKKILRIVLSYTDYINRAVWRKAL